MSTESRIAHEPWQCPWCGETVLANHVIAAMTVGTTDSLGCIPCAWAAMNNDIDSRRTNKPPASEETRG